jgi:hypothetical protein
VIKQALLEGAQDALAEYGLAPKREKSKIRKALPYLAAGAAGLGGYKLLRMPRFTAGPALREMQELAANKGFHRVVDVTPTKLETGATLGDRFQHFMAPRASLSGDLNTWNRLKLLLQEGTSEAIPVVEQKGKQRIAGGKRKGPVKGVVFGRQSISPSTTAPAVRGGVDLEGPAETQTALNELSRKGKGYEADIVQQHAPGAMPLTHSDISKHLAGGGDLPTMQSRLREAFGGEDWLLKPKGGLASGGNFPSLENDWQAQHAAYTAHMADPASRAAYDAAVAEGGNAPSHYLRKHDLYKGYVLDQMLKDPASVMAQQKIPNILNEYRVHLVGGEAPTSTIFPRFTEGVKGQMRAAPTRVGVGKSTKDIKAFSEDVMRKLPEEYRKGTFGFDVVAYKRPDGTIGHQLVELNPTEGATPEAAGGGSGYLDPRSVPFTGHRHYKAITGRSTPLMAGLGGGLAGGAVGLATKQLTDDDR